MSSQFSYELDERQIRLLMQDSELEYDPGAWDKFEQALQTQTKSHLNTFTPKINFAISRSVIVPAIFVILIGGLSAMLFSFVDFKKKDDTLKETALIEKTKPITKKGIINKPSPVKITAVKQSPIKAVETATLTKSVTIEPNLIPKTVTPVIEKVKEPVVEKTENATLNVTVNKSRRRHKKAISEEIPTINTSSNTNLNAGNAEPELELK